MRPQDRENLVMLALFWAMVGVFVYFALHYLLPWLLPFFLGAGVAALARPAVLKLHRRTGIGEKACAGVVLAVFYLAVRLRCFSPSSLRRFMSCLRACQRCTHKILRRC